MKRLSRLLLSGLVSMLLGVAGCHAKSAKYKATGGGALNSTNSVACLAIVQGFEMENGVREAEMRNFFYLMIVCPGAKLSPNSTFGSGIDGEARCEIYYEWETTQGKVQVKLLWDTQSDVIAIGGAKFSRKKGNVFLISRKENGSLEAQQCGALGSKASYVEIEKRVREQMPANQDIRGVSFPAH